MIKQAPFLDFIPVVPDILDEGPLLKIKKYPTSPTHAHNSSCTFRTYRVRKSLTHLEICGLLASTTLPSSSGRLGAITDYEGTRVWSNRLCCSQNS
jgi:hypothetical protein